MKPEIRSHTQEIGDRVTFGERVRIRGDAVLIGDDCIIGDDVDIFCPEGFFLGACSYIGPGTRITCWKFDAWDYQYYEREFEVGRGGCLSGPDSTVNIGRAFFAGPHVVLNPNCHINIGDEVGLGDSTAIWTHGAWLSELDGFPTKFAPVTIGNRVWLPGNTRVLPGVTIGNDVVVGMGSLVTRDLPPGCLAGGMPAKILKESVFPSNPQNDNLEAQMDVIICDYLDSAEWRELQVSITYDRGRILFISRGCSYTFDILNKRVEPNLSPEAEDFRDFLRRRGIRFLTGRPFKSIPHPMVKQWLAV